MQSHQLRFLWVFFLCVDSIPDKKKQRGILKNIFIIFWANVHNAHVEIQALPNIFFFILKNCYVLVRKIM